MSFRFPGTFNNDMMLILDIQLAGCVPKKGCFVQITVFKVLNFVNRSGRNVQMGIPNAPGKLVCLALVPLRINQKAKAVFKTEL